MGYTFQTQQGKSMRKISKKLEYDPRNADWVDFQKKIEYLKEVMFEGREDILTEYLIDTRSSRPKSGRKKTITNWLEGNISKPKGFEVKKFKLGDLRLDDEPLFTDKSFRLWSLDRFIQRVDSYLNHKDVQSHLKYIYFFDSNSHIQKVVAFTISFPNPKSKESIQLQYENILYTGTIESFNNMTYINVKNKFDYINFIFKISANTTNSLRAFGKGISVDDSTGRPKAFSALLTSYSLTKEEQDKLTHKLNFSNTMIAEEFSQDCVLKEDYFMENFVQKLDRLGRDINHCSIKKEFSEEIHLYNIFKEYQRYVKFIEKVYWQTKYSINSEQEADLFSMKGVCKEKREEVTIVYFLTLENLFLLDNKNPIIEEQIKHIKEGKLLLHYIFVVVDMRLISDAVIQKIEYMEANGIDVKLTNFSTISYSKLFLIENSHFAMFKVNNVVDSPHVTRHKQTIDKLYLEKNQLDKGAMSLHAFMAKHNPLCGSWYFYSYGSAMDKDDCHEILMEIKNNKIKGYFSSGVHDGTLHKGERQILLIFKNSVIKISLFNLNNTLFQVSTIGQDIYIPQNDLLVFGLFSKEKLKKSDALGLLETLYMKEEADYRLKTSDTSSRKFADFKKNQKNKL